MVLRLCGMFNNSTVWNMLFEAYAPQDVTQILFVLGLLLGCLLLGFGCVRLAMVQAKLGRFCSWLLLFSGFVVVSMLCAEEAAGFRMLSIIAMVLFAMKAVVSVEVWIEKKIALPWFAWFAWAATWPGMAPELFARRSPDRAQNIAEARNLLSRGVVRLLLGALLMFCAHNVWFYSKSLLLGTMVGLPGISLVLHFGLFNIVAGCWRLFGFPTYVLFPAPLVSYSLSEFWGKRWNLPFTEMIQRGVYRPLSSVLGRSKALRRPKHRLVHQI